MAYITGINTQVGRKDDQEKNRLDLIEPEFIEGVGKVLTVGAKKYAPNSWKNVDDAENRYYAATDEMKETGRNSDDIMEKTMEKLDKREYTEEERRIIDDILREYLG